MLCIDGARMEHEHEQETIREDIDNYYPYKYFNKYRKIYKLENFIMKDD